MPKELKLINSALTSIVDDHIYAGINHLEWCIDSTNGYVRTPRGVYLHRWLMDEPTFPFIVNHVNRNKLDNRKENLRLSNKSLNMANSNPRTGKKYKGVDFMKTKNKWRARIRKDYVQTHIGLYDSIEEAALAYNKIAIKLFGSHANINII